MIRNLDFFKNLFASYESENNAEILLALCAEMKYETAKMGTFVFHQGDESNQKFYVVLSGQVGVALKKDFSPFLKRNSISSRPLALTLQVIKDDSNEVMGADDSGKVDNDTPKRKSTLRFGESFGVAVMKTMASKKVAVKARQILKARSQVTSLSSLEDEEPENNDQDFKELIEKYGTLVRVLGPGNDFGDAGALTLFNRG